MPTGDLAIDYGTSNTVALVRGSDGRTRQLLFDGSPLLPSAVLAAPDGGLRAGRDAVRAARLDPGRYEPNPKRRIDESEVLLGERVYPIGQLIAATLAMVRGEAQRLTGGLPGRVLLTHPVAWGATRRAVLSDACVRAGLPAPTLIPEPVAAATYFAALPYVRIGAGQAVVVYDLGAGTFDVSVVRKGNQGFETLGYNGLDDVGGLDLDAVVVQHALGPLAQADPAAWQRLTNPRGTDDRRHHRMLWDDARDAKETLSRQQKATFPMPLTDGDTMITRAEFERGAQPLLLRTVEVTTEAIRQSRVPADQLAGVFLVGGGSRIPLVATLLHQRQGVAPTALEQPEIVVAEGALAAVHGGGVRGSGGQGYAGAPPMGGSPVSGPPMGGPPVSGPPMGGPPVSGPPMGGSPVSGPPVSGPPVGVGGGPAGPAPGVPGLLWPSASSYTPPADPPVPPLSGPPGQSPLRGSDPARSGGRPSDDPFGPPPVLDVPQQHSMVWPDAPFDHRSPGGQPESSTPSSRPPTNRPSSNRPSTNRPPTSRPPTSRPPTQPGDRYGSPNRSGGHSSPTSGGPSWPSDAPGNAQGVSQNRAASGRPAPAASGRAYGRPARARQVFVATDLLWLVPTLLWLAVAFGVDWDPSRATLFAITSLTLGVLGYPLDTRFGRRLPWWAKPAIPGVGGVVAAVALDATGSTPIAYAVLALAVSAGIAWLVMRRR
ncbi:Hsp70 family protein [Virgisporangium ochraceum]|uniref:Hsp70 protein n=1 Tax=Virgisporangium ochraceum TaxID=65505 RepID=A0A8J4EEQ2_9ACTN|nr:Hsp70 family protein [Virgisporangium ochraceum]GIJ71863.1 hypothetical protein Voc01_067800 [Virgisporangium ochraceum]